MPKRKRRESSPLVFSEAPSEELYDLIYAILRYGILGVSRIDFLREVSTLLIDFTRCDAVELRLREREKFFCCKLNRNPRETSFFEVPVSSKERDTLPGAPEDSGLENLCRDMMAFRFLPRHPLSEKEIFQTGHTNRKYCFQVAGDTETEDREYLIGGDYQSTALIPIYVGEEKIGLILFQSKKEECFTRDMINMFDSIARNIGIAVVDRQTHISLRERIKELTCLYKIAQLMEHSGTAPAVFLKDIVELLPPSLLYPEIASARIVFDGVQFSTPAFRIIGKKLKAPVLVNNKTRGLVEVGYRKRKPDLDWGPFLKEEVSLIEAVAKQVGLIIERKQAEEETVRLQDQLRHADRLATIGQLAAGVAHELNEPLSNILGYSQLALKSPALPGEVSRDIEKITKASLHAREIIRKLQIFARQSPPSKRAVNLNRIVEEGIFFLESRCSKAGIELRRSLSPQLPEITADPSQLNQVLVNLVVNAIQAMPEGGQLTVSTSTEKNSVRLIVEDTGIGMSEDIKKQIFIPFFTTKDIGQGTGLGLPVVHGIIASHGGSIRVESEVGRGTRFIIALPANKPDYHPSGASYGQFG